MYISICIYIYALYIIINIQLYIYIYVCAYIYTNDPAVKPLESPEHTRRSTASHQLDVIPAVDKILSRHLTDFGVREKKKTKYWLVV